MLKIDKLNLILDLEKNTLRISKKVFKLSGDFYK